MQPVPPVPPPMENMGTPDPRYEARSKVTGRARYAADEPVSNPAWAFLVTSAIAKGKVRRFLADEAKAIPGVLAIITHENAPKREKVAFFGDGGYVSTSLVPMQGPDIHHAGQIIGVVLADSYETAREAAHRLRVEYEVAEPVAGFRSPGAQTVELAAVKKSHKDVGVGDIDKGLAGAAVSVDAEYFTPTQHHNPIELFSTTAVWDGDELTIYEPSQFVYALKNCVARQLALAPEKVHVINPYVGGAFGSKGAPTQRTALIAALARDLGRPVKLVVARDQGFFITTYRAETRHRVRLGATPDGKLTAYGHEGWELTSMVDNYDVAGTENTAEMYASPNVWTKVNLVKADRNTPGFMRSPPEVPYMYALECAMDELAVALNMDPVELRRVNDTMKSPINGAAYTSRSLMKCYDAAAAQFGWSRRDPRPGSMRDGEWLVGWGCATATYPTNMMPSAARVRLGGDGTARVQVAAHDVGTGAYTVIGQAAAEFLGIQADKVVVELGDSRLPPGPVAGGSMTTASACSAVKLACDRIRERLGGAVPADAKALAGMFEKLKVGSLEEYAEWAPPGGEKGLAALHEGRMGGGSGERGGGSPRPAMFAFGAEFVEVRIHSRTKEIRVPRITGAFAGGRILNPRTARSQYLGGMIWGIGSALHEATEIDEKRARYVNANIAEYLIPVNADVPLVEIIMVPEVDTEVNPIGVKGIGELSNVGTAAAIANAVYHATGKRIRDLPIRPESLV